MVNQQMEEMTNLKKIAEKQLEEALESLQVSMKGERERLEGERQVSMLEEGEGGGRETRVDIEEQERKRKIQKI